MKPRILVTRRWPAAVEARLTEHFDAVLNTGDKPLSLKEFRTATILICYLQVVTSIKKWKRITLIW